MGRHLSPRYGQVILVSGYPVLTAVNWSKHWCPICVHYQFSCAPKLAKKYEIEHCSRSSKTINWSADSFQINHVTSMSWHMSPRYVHVIPVSGYLVLTAVSWPYCECPMLKMWFEKTRLRHPSFLLIVSPTPTRTICSSAPLCSSAIKSRIWRERKNPVGANMPRPRWPNWVI